MNLRQNYFEKIIDVQEYKIDSEWASKYDFVKVKMKVNYHGTIIEHEKVFDNYEWELVQRHGYYLD